MTSSTFRREDARPLTYEQRPKNLMATDHTVIGNPRPLSLLEARNSNRLWLKQYKLPRKVADRIFSQFNQLITECYGVTNELTVQFIGNTQQEAMKAAYGELRRNQFFLDEAVFLPQLSLLLELFRTYDYDFTSYYTPDPQNATVTFHLK